MKNTVLFIILVIFLTALLPYFAVRYFCENYGIKKNSDTVTVYIKAENKTEKMNLNQYLKEVVAAEMPAEFNEEALKAQAVAARTYLVNRIRKYEKSGIPEEHHGAYICTDCTHCKAWIREKERKELWGEENSDKYWKKISDAVDDTNGLIITYNGEPIEAVFHSTSSGYTENAADVWGGNVDYLVSVKSEGDENSPKYSSEKTFTIDEFKAVAQNHIADVNWDSSIIGNIVRSDAGGIKTIEIGGKTVKGSDFRFMYGLQSTNAYITTDDKNVIISVKGYGHGVGMSQYGADYLAGEGKGFEEILKTYYSGVEFEKVNSIYYTAK